MIFVPSFVALLRTHVRMKKRKVEIQPFSVCARPHDYPNRTIELAARARHLSDELRAQKFPLELESSSYPEEQYSESDWHVLYKYIIS